MNPFRRVMSLLLSKQALLYVGGVGARAAYEDDTPTVICIHHHHIIKVQVWAGFVPFHPR